MAIVHEIFDALGGPSAIARATGFKLQTVCDWRVKGTAEIPPWRRGAVLKAAHDLGVVLSPDALEYLQSETREPRPVAA